MQARRATPAIKAARVAVCAICVGLGWPAVGAADWLVSPFVGVKLGGETSLVDLEQGAGETKLTFGGSFGLLGDGILGVEFDVGHSPGFFDASGGDGLVVGSSVTTLTGNVLIALPKDVTRGSLRPYAVSGIGLMRASSDDLAGIFAIDRTFLATTFGGGAMGALTRNTSLRFELRYFRSRGQGDAQGLGFGVAGLRFWRATVGATLHY